MSSRVGKLCKANRIFRRFAGRSHSHPREARPISPVPTRKGYSPSPRHVSSGGHQRRHRLCEKDRQKIREILKIFIVQRAPRLNELERIRDLLYSMYDDGDVTSEIDESGLNIIQWMVIWNCHELLAEVLFTKGYWHNINSYPCNAPLHLACKFGHREMVKTLLENGADVNMKSTACYPMRGLHTVVRPQHYHTRALCFVRASDKPIKVAFRRDNIEVVKELLENDNSSSLIDTTCLLHDACKVDAKRCVEYLISMFPEKINERRPGNGETPLEVAIWNAEACAEILLESGALVEDDVLRDCTGKRQTVLHVIYSSPSCIHPYSLSQLIEQSYQLKDLITCRDRAGNTPLHVLFRNVGKRIADREKQMMRDNETFECVKFLLDKGADPHILNNRGENCLHLLFEDNTARSLYGMAAEYHRVVLEEVNKILMLLLNCRPEMDLNHYSEHVSSVCNRVIRILCSMEEYQVKSAGCKILNSLTILCKHGADPTIPDEKGIYIVTRILTAANRWLSHSADDASCAQGVFASTKELVDLLFKFGHQTPFEILKLAVKQVAIMTNIHFRNANFMEHLDNLLIAVFNAGLDPNYLGDSKIKIKESARADDVTYFIARAFVIHKYSEAVVVFFHIFQDNMTQDNFNKFKNIIFHLLRTEFSDTSQLNTNDAIKMLEKRFYKPRSLLSLCRAEINHALRWQLTDNAQTLPLPTEVKQYLFCS